MTKKKKEQKPYTGIGDEIKEQHQKTKNMTFKEKLSYFWYYYKIHTIVAVLTLIFIVSLAHTMLTAKSFSFYGIMMNSFGLSSEAMAQSFGEYAGLDMENYECYIDTSSTLSAEANPQISMATTQKVMALLQTGDLDTMVLASSDFFDYAFNETFLDLRTVLSEEELAFYQDYLYYVDYEEIRTARENYEIPDVSEPLPQPTIEEIAAEAESHLHPESMAEPVPVGILLSQAPFVLTTESYGSQIPVFGITATSKRPETAVSFLHYLWDKSVDFTQIRSTSLF